ncbi:hypothetical protein TNCV_771221 [Trichonephila clavipes]|nr:hypothetical protein TNCV_771221 [Trichonephila clavipes]
MCRNRYGEDPVRSTTSAEDRCFAISKKENRSITGIECYHWFVFNFQGTLGTLDYYASTPLFPEHSSPYTASFGSREIFLRSVTLFPLFLFLLLRESFHYPPPIDSSCPGNHKERTMAWFGHYPFLTFISNIVASRAPKHLFTN